MRALKVTLITTTALVGLLAAALLSAPADAAEIKRVKCRVGNNVQIAVSIRDIAAGINSVQVTIDNLSSNSEPPAMPILGSVDVEGDAQVEWDSGIDAADPAEGQRAPISRAFASVGSTVSASALGLTATGTCVAK